jgi:2-polyprenyl-3-methyl-5-hydroxy-6-metoxy-1,4-benzoquinol methylase
MSESNKPMNCPVCFSNKVVCINKLIDYSVSGEVFELMECKDCTLRFTHPAPAQEKIGAYYQSSEYISHTNEQKGMTGFLYRKVRKWTLQRKAALLIRLSQKKVGMHLDLGAGTGAFVHEMEKAGWNSVGFEPDEKARKMANRLYKAPVYPLEDFFRIAEGGYDVITLWHALEHIHPLQETVHRLEKLLTAKGKLIVAVPNFSSYDARYYKNYWAAYDVPRHLYHFSPKSMRRLMEQHGLIIKAIRPMWFDSFYVSILSEKYKKGFFLKGMFIGLISNLYALFQVKNCSSLLYIMEREVQEE